MSLDEYKYTLLRETASLIERIVPQVCPRGAPLNVVFRTQQGAKKLRLGVEWAETTEVPSAEEWKSIITAANQAVKSEEALALIKQIALTGVNDKRASTKEKDTKCLEVLINITGTMPTGPAATKAKAGTTVAGSGVNVLTAEHMPVLQGDSIASAFACILFEVRRTAADASSQASSSTSSSAPSIQEELLAERIKPILMQFKNASYSSGFVAASSK